MRLAGAVALALPLAAAWPLPAVAGLSLSPLIVDLAPGGPPRADVELFNSGPERLYVVVEPARIDDPGLPGEHRVTAPDPEALGLIATPGRAILEPGQRKFLRIAALQPPAGRDRVFRVTVKPVVGDVSGAATGLKLLVGYDMLVIQRARDPKAEVVATPTASGLRLRNDGTTNAELFRGRACAPAGSPCEDLPSQRIYAGAQVDVAMKPGWKAQYDVKVLDRVSVKRF